VGQIVPRLIGIMQTRKTLGGINEDRFQNRLPAAARGGLPMERWDQRGRKGRL